MSSGDDRDAEIRQLRADGWTAVEIADAAGLSRSQVHRILAVVGDPARGDDDDDELDDEGTEVVEEVEYPPPPWTFCGTVVELVTVGSNQPIVTEESAGSPRTGLR